MAVVDTTSTDLVHVDPGTVATYVDLYQRLVAASLSTSDSLDMLTTHAETLAYQTRI